MRKVINELDTVLNMIKGLETASTSENDKAMLLSLDGKVYRIDISEVAEGDITLKHVDGLKDQ